MPAAVPVPWVSTVVGLVQAGAPVMCALNGTCALPAVAGASPTTPTVTIVTSRITSAMPRFVLRLWIVVFMAVSFCVVSFESSAKRMRAPRAFTRSCVGLASNQRVVPRRPGAVRRARRRARVESKFICPDVGTTFRLSDTWALLVDLPLRGHCGLDAAARVPEACLVQANDGSGGGEIRLAELVASLSLATDLGRGQPMEHSIRQTLIALRLAGVPRAGKGKPTAL